MADVKKVAEVAATVAEPAVAATISTGELDYKKVAIVAGATIVVTGLGVVGYIAYKKHKAKKEAEISEAHEETEWESPETETQEAPKKKK